MKGEKGSRSLPSMQQRRFRKRSFVLASSNYVHHQELEQQGEEMSNQY